MKLNDFLEMLKNVRPAGRGWSARCPAHDDRHPSLHVRKGERGLLVKCWAGCHIKQICQGLKIQVRDLFFEPVSTNRNKPTRHKPKSYPPVPYLKQSRVLRDYASQFQVIADGFYFHSDTVLNAAKGLTIQDWNEKELEEAWEVVDRAYQQMRLVDAMDDLVFFLQDEALQMEKRNGRRSGSIN